MRAKVEKIYRTSTKAKKNQSKVSNSASLAVAIPTLNDDCILKIFSYLKLEDLSRTKDCCRRFSWLADYTVQQKCKNEFVRLPTKQNAADAASILTKFGHEIEHLQIDDETRFIRFCNQNCNKFNSMIKNCKNLKCLRLKNVSFGNVGFQKLKQSLQNIEALELGNCDFTSMHVNEFLKTCGKLTKFTIHGATSPITSEMCLSVLQNGSALESITFRNCRYDISTAEFFKFIADLKRLNNMKKLDVGCVRQRSILPILHEMVESNSQLETIAFSGFVPKSSDFFDFLKQMKRLRTCKLFNKGVISGAVAAAAATDFSIKTVKCAGKKYPNVTTLRKK